MLSSCAYVSEHSEQYMPTDGNIQYYESIVNDDTTIETRVRNLKNSGFSFPFILNISKMVGPYCLDLKIRDSKTSIKELIIHSIIVRDTSSKEEIIVHLKKDEALKLPLIKGVNGKGDVSYWPKKDLLSEKIFQPLIYKDQPIDVIIDISIVSSNTIRKTLTLSFKANVLTYKQWHSWKDMLEFYKGYGV